MDETVEEEVVTVGQRLREAREAKGLSVEDIASSTRIPTRHLNSLEASDWERLPAPTYAIGFAKNFAAAVGLDREEIGEQLRTEMGGFRPATMAFPEVYEAADPARTMPKGLIIGALLLLAVVVAGLMWLRSQSQQAEPVAEPPANTVEAAPTTPAPATTPAQLVVLTATDAVWVDIRDGQQLLKQGEMAVGERFEVPATAAQPLLTTGKPEALQILVGQTAAPPIGTPGRRVSNVSLKGGDLLQSAAATATPAAPAQSSATPARRPAATRSPAISPPAATATNPAAPPTADTAPAEATPTE